jgi:hypothetical protein
VVSCGSSRSCFVTRKLSGSATTSKPCARSKRVTPPPDPDPDCNCRDRLGKR